MTRAWRMFGRLLEISLAAPDIAASVRFYESLGFTQLATTDTWSHPYGVLSDGRLQLGLHQWSKPTPLLSFVQPELIRHVQRLPAAGIQPVASRLGDEDFHQIELIAPCGQAIALLEARTYSPASEGATRESLCGYFSHYGMPVTDVDAARDFWERAGFIALDEVQEPYPHLPLTSDWLDLGFHQRRSINMPLFAFEVSDLDARRAQLTDAQVPMPALPRSLDAQRHMLIQAPEGTLLLLSGS